MSVSAVICEYNPFHYGHLYQFQRVKELLGHDTVLLCLMSGSLVQRGEVAVASKYDRAAAALTMGADLVLELPYPYSASVAEHFALGAVSILQDLGVVDHLVFGSEAGSIADLRKHVQRRNSREFALKFDLLRKERRELSYPQLVDCCYRALYNEDFPKGANDILGMYYLKALEDLHSDIQPNTHLRLEGASATAARAELKKGSLDGIPEEARAYFEKLPANVSYAERAILMMLRQSEDTVMRKAAQNATNYEDLCKILSSKNNTTARIRREILHTLLGYKESSFTLPKFTSVLAANEKGMDVLKKAKKTSRIPIITKPADYKKHPEIAAQFEMNLQADGLYSLACPTAMPHNWSLFITPYIKNEKGLAFFEKV